MTIARGANRIDAPTTSKEAPSAYRGRAPAACLSNRRRARTNTVRITTKPSAEQARPTGIPTASAVTSELPAAIDPDASSAPIPKDTTAANTNGVPDSIAKCPRLRANTSIAATPATAASRKGHDFKNSKSVPSIWKPISALASAPTSNTAKKGRIPTPAATPTAISS